MTSFDPSSDELVSAYLDGEATEAERARVEADPELRARVETFRAISSAVATPPLMPDAAAREAAIAAALGASATSSKVTSLAPVQERRSRFAGPRAAVLSAAAVILVLFLGGAIIAGIGGNNGADVATDASSDSAGSDAFDATATMDDGETFGGDDEAEEEAMEEPAEAMAEDTADSDDAIAEEAMEEEEAMEDDAAMEDTAPADEADEGTAGDGSAESTPAFEVRSFGSLEELTDAFTEQEEREKAEPQEPLVFTGEVIDMADACRAERNESDTNSLVFIEPAILTDAEGVSVNVLVYRDELIDADPFIRVFEFGTCAPIQ